MNVTTVADFHTHVTQMPTLRVGWAELAPEQPGLQQSPRFVLGEVPGGLVLPMLGEFVAGPVRCYLARDLRIGPDGMLLDGTVALHSPVLNLPESHVSVLAGTLNAEPRRPVRRLEGRAVWLTGPGSRVYGHWLVDFLPRLYSIQACGHDLSTLMYVMAQPVAPFVVRLLEAFGIGAHQLAPYDELHELLEVEELLVATNMRRGGRLHPLMRDSRDLLVQRAAASPANHALHAAPTHERIFVSRIEADRSRTLLNRVAIEQIASDAGFVVVRPETMSIAAQIGLFAGARQIVGEYGSGLHNVMFSQPGAVTCALRGSSIHPGFIQTAISDVFRQSIGYVLAPTPIDAVDQVPEVPEHAFRIALACCGLIANEGANRT